MFLSTIYSQPIFIGCLPLPLFPNGSEDIFVVAIVEMGHFFGFLTGTFFWFSGGKNEESVIRRDQWNIFAIRGINLVSKINDFIIGKFYLFQTVSGLFN